MNFFDRYADRIIILAESGCWVWMGALDRKGYGRHGVPKERRTASAHRTAFEAACGEIPQGMGVCHRCDIPACVNPDHLFAGTQKANATDMAKKGRHGRTKLTPPDVRDIRTLRRRGQSQREVAQRYGVDKATIAQIDKGLTWRHVV